MAMKLNHIICQLRANMWTGIIEHNGRDSIRAWGLYPSCGAYKAVTIIAYSAYHKPSEPVYLRVVINDNYGPKQL
jgi:hypothetical protein